MNSIHQNNHLDIKSLYFLAIYSRKTVSKNVIYIRIQEETKTCVQKGHSSNTITQPINKIQIDEMGRITSNNW